MIKIKSNKVIVLILLASISMACGWFKKTESERIQAEQKIKEDALLDRLHKEYPGAIDYERDYLFAHGQYTVKINGSLPFGVG